MPPSKTIAACAVSVMAMVFSVQQGEHGPLVVYKLKLPETSARAVQSPEPFAPSVKPLALTAPLLGTAVPLSQPRPAPAPARFDAPAAYRPGPLQPTVLGTVVMPATALHSAVPLYPAPAPARDFEIAAPDDQPDFRVVANTVVSEAMMNQETGELLTLDEVNNAVLWRRDTVEKLRQVPITPRF